MRIFLAGLLCLLGLGTSLLAESPRIIASFGQQMTGSAPEAGLRYLAPCCGRIQPVLGASFGSNGSAWLGAGAAITWQPGLSELFLRASSMAGLHRRGTGPALGGPVEFRSALDLGFRRQSGTEIGIGLDHRSNAGIYKSNPGLNTGYLFYSVALK